MNRGEYVGFCRFISNPKILPENLITATINKTSELVTGKDILVINDTTEFNYRQHKYFDLNDNDLGLTANNKDIGFFLHPGYVVDSASGIGLGFSYIKVWNRHFDKLDKNQRQYWKQSIYDKESYRWIECGNESKKHLSSANHITLIADRESDIYEEFIEVPDNKLDLLIRSCRNRALFDSQEKLYEKISQTPCKGTFLLEIKKHKNKKSRLASIEVRYDTFKIKRPEKSNKKSLPEFVEVFVVEAKEQINSVPEDEEPIKWVLLTTLHIETFEHAMDVIEKYKSRWEIELLFGTMKSKGLNLELSQLETGKSLKVLCIMTLISAMRIMQLRQAGRCEHEIDAGIAFKKEELEVLKLLAKKYEGRTNKQKNPYKPDTIAWAAWIIARIGGWKGYSSESPPGFKTYTIGLVKFDRIFEGYNLLKRNVHR